MIIRDRAKVVLVDPRSKGVFHLDDNSLRALLTADSMPVDTLRNHDQVTHVIDAAYQVGVLEERDAGASAYNARVILARLEQAIDADYYGILNPPALPTVNITESCGFACPHCYNSGDQPKRSDMEAGFIIAHVLGPLAELGCKNVVWTGGDPVLVPDRVLACTEAAVSLGISVATQAAEVSEDFIHAFAQAGGQGIQFTLVSTPSQAHIHDKFRGRQGNCIRTVEGIRHSKALGLSVFVNMPLYPGNITQLEATTTLLQELNVDTFRTTLAAPIGRARDNRSLLEFSDDRIQDILRRCASLDEQYGDHINIMTDVSRVSERHASPYSFCNAGMTYLHVADHHVYPCNFMMQDEFCLGSLHEFGLESIWQDSPRLRPFRQVSPIHEDCIGCTTRRGTELVCTDCKAVMWMRHGAFLSSHVVPCRAMSDVCSIGVPRPRDEPPSQGDRRPDARTQALADFRQDARRDGLRGHHPRDRHQG